MFSAGRVLLMPKGAYNPLTTYEMLDIVSYNGSSYIAKGTTTGNLPTDTTYWQLSAYGGQAANIAGNFAELESSSVATATHYVDDIFVDENSQLMKATQTINIGDTIDANVNCAPTTVEALIAYLSSYVDSLDSLNKKIQGAIEIAAQTDLHSLAIGEYYKKQTTFYITNGPTGIDQEPTAIFRLTVEAALDNASQASSPLLLTLRTPGGVVYTQSFDGSAWGSWVEVASAASVSALNTAKQPKTLDTPITVGGVQQTTVEGALGSINQTLTNEVDAIVNVYGSKNLMLPIPTRSANGVTFTSNPDKSVTITGTAENDGGIILQEIDLKAGSYILSRGNVSGTKPSFYLYDGTNIIAELGFNDVNSTEFTIATDKHLQVDSWMVQGSTYNVTFKPMLRDARIADSTYEPYSMTNQELTPIAQAVSNRNLLDNPWFTINQRGANSYSAAGYTVDRWIRNASESDGHTLTVGNVTLPLNKNDFYQPILDSDCHLEANQTYTLSAIVDGNLYPRTFTAVGDGATHYHNGPLVDGLYFNIIENWDTGIHKHLFGINNIVTTQDHVITAIKLERGSVSTLAQDTAPNYQQELAKCQRYFQCLRGSLGMGFFKVADAVECVCPIPVPMRATPTATITNNVGIVADDAYSAYATGINPWGEFPDSCIGFDLTGFSHAAGSVCRLFTNNGGAINLSADL